MEAERRSGRKTVLRTIRITKELDELLAKDASAKRMTVNGLLSSMFTKYAEWDRYAEKLDHISVSRDFFRSVLRAVDEKKLMELAQNQGIGAPRQAIPFWFKKLDFETFLAWISVYAKYGGFSGFEIDSDGRNYTMVVRHGLGEIWSRFITAWLKQAMASIDLTPRVEMTDATVVIRFSRN